MSFESQRTHLAALYGVLSFLTRLGFSIEEIREKNIVNIVAKKTENKKIKIDVKGLKNTSNWPFSLKPKLDADFYIFVCYLNEFEDIESEPEYFILPLEKIESYLTFWKSRAGIEYRKIADTKYKNAWNLIK